jgi:hypothetical protein
LDRIHGKRKRDEEERPHGGGVPIEEGKEWEDVDMTTLREISRANEMYRTPAKLKIGRFIAKTTDSVVTGMSIDMSTFVKVEKLNLDVTSGSVDSEVSVN